jgi:electron transport complex protein RnfB
MSPENSPYGGGEMPSELSSTLFQNVLDALPQTQCTRCGYPDCEGYAKAIVFDNVPINQCPPGGSDGIKRLSSITGQKITPLNPANGVEGPVFTAWIDEDVCIGCTLCINACPTDAILGTHKKMHTVIEKYCTGCELCIPVCPVNCILLDNISHAKTAWDAWSLGLAEQAKTRYSAHKLRLHQSGLDQQEKLKAKALEHLKDLDQTTNMPPLKEAQEHQAQLKRKTDIINAALERARIKQEQKNEKLR